MSIKFKLNLLISIMLAWMSVSTQGQGIINTSGTQLIINGAANIVIHNAGFTNNGTFTAGSGTMNFTGNTATANSFINGTSAIDFYNLTLNKSANGIQLNKNINVSNLITFTSGDSLFLNNNIIDLGTTGSLSGESNSSRITGETGGYIQRTQTLNAPVAVNPGNLGIEITSSVNLGSTVIKRAHTVFQGKSIKRSMEIIPTNNTALDATLVFHYFPAELNGIPEPSLTDYSSNNSGGNWTAVTNSILNTGADIITTTNVNSMKLFTLFFSGAVLPVQLLYLKGKETGGAVQLDWATSAETENDHFDVEHSLNGTIFTKIGSVKGNGNCSQLQAYRFTDTYAAPGRNFYRLKQVDYNEHFIYSQTISLQLQPKISVIISPNPATSLIHVSIMSPVAEQKQIKLTDENGRTWQSGSLFCIKGENNFSMKIDQLPKGMYYLLIDGQEDQSARFIKL